MDYKNINTVTEYQREMQKPEVVDAHSKIIEMLNKPEQLEGLSINDMVTTIKKANLDPVKFELLKQMSIEQDNKLFLTGLQKVEESGNHPLDLMKPELKAGFVLYHAQQVDANRTNIKEFGSPGLSSYENFDVNAAPVLKADTKLSVIDRMKNMAQKFIFNETKNENKYKL